jgi:hypothetical protein
MGLAVSLTCFPAKAGIQSFRPCRWTPAFAGEQKCPGQQGNR